MKINTKNISEIKIAGRGGKENEALRLLPGYRRASAPLYDFQSCRGKHRVELKKQQNLQWFDAGKYHNLSKGERDITMLFVVHDGQSICNIYSISLGSMLDILCADKDYKKLSLIHI